MRPLHPTTLLAAVVCLDLALCSVPSHPQNTGRTVVAANKPGALAGIQSVYVITEDVDPSLADVNVTRETLENAVIARLETAGIKVLTKAQKTAHTPLLSVTLGATPAAGHTGISYTLQLNLQDNVFLQRNPKIEVVSASLWQTETFGYSNGRSRETLLIEAEDLADDFIRDYKAANPNALHPRPGAQLSLANHADSITPQDSLQVSANNYRANNQAENFFR